MPLRRMRQPLCGTPDSVAGRFIYSLPQLPDKVLAEVQLELAYEQARRHEVNSLLSNILGNKL